MLGQLDRRVELPGGHVKRAAEQADPAQHGRGVGVPSRLPHRAGTVGEPRGGPQRGDPGLDDAGRHRGRSGLDDRLDHGVADHFTGRVPGLAHGRLNGGTGSHAELGARPR
jgi:hypothetical protein